MGKNGKEWETCLEGPVQEWHEEVSLPTHNVMWMKALLLARFLILVGSWGLCKTSILPLECQMFRKGHRF